MKISYRNNKALEYLNSDAFRAFRPKLFNGDIDWYKDYEGHFVNNWKHYLSSFNENIFIVAKSFTDASTKAVTKLAELYNDIVNDDSSDFLIKGTYVIGGLTICIHYQFWAKKKDFEVSMFVFDINGILVASIFNNPLYHLPLWFSSELNDTANQVTSNVEREKLIRGIYNEVIIYHMFKSYAEVETVYVKGNSKKVSDKKYVNDTNQNVTFLDSTWFTNLVRSEEFKVSGHFRLQVCGEGRKDKKLIWINDFVKTGYTRKAQILN